MKPTLLLLMATMVGCCDNRASERGLYGNDANYAYGCHKEGALFVFDNDNYNGSNKRGISKVSCAYALENWYALPDPRYEQMERERDPKTGMLP